jgi:hypothetical protein
LVVIKKYQSDTGCLVNQPAKNMTFFVTEHWVLLNLHLRIWNRNTENISVDGLQSYCTAIPHTTLKLKGNATKY